MKLLIRFKISSDIDVMWTLSKQSVSSYKKLFKKKKINKEKNPKEFKKRYIKNSQMEDISRDSGDFCLNSRPSQIQL